MALSFKRKLLLVMRRTIPFMLVGLDVIKEHPTMATLFMGVVLINAALYMIPAIKLKDPPELYERGDAGAESLSWVQLRKAAKSIMSMRAFWAAAPRSTSPSCRILAGSAPCFS